MAPARHATLRAGLIATVASISAVLPIAVAQAAGPRPQKAPVTTPAPAPTPDPAPSAQHRTTTTTTHVPASAPTQVTASTPARQSVVTTPAPPASTAQAHRRLRASAPHHHRRARSHPRHHRAPARLTAPSSPVVRSGPSAVTRHLTARPAAAHNHGVVLLIGALVLLALVAASLSLLRVAHRLDREIMGPAG